MYYNPMPPQSTGTQAWVNAALRLKSQGSLNGLMLHIENPVEVTEADIAVIDRLDAFLREHGSFPISTVSNTIFPERLLRQGGAEALYADYLKVYPRAKRACPDWGRYFHRMISWSGADGKPVNQLQTVIDNLRRYAPDSDKFISNMYEITLFNPSKDSNKFQGRQCLSFLEFKPERIGNKGRLHMMAIYRSHYYISKTLGNLIGLGKLQAFVARETGLEVGSLTINSTYATLDGGKHSATHGSRAWGLPKARALIDECANLSGIKLA